MLLRCDLNAHRTRRMYEVISRDVGSEPRPCSRHTIHHISWMSHVWTVMEVRFFFSFSTVSVCLPVFHKDDRRQLSQTRLKTKSTITVKWGSTIELDNYKRWIKSTWVFKPMATLCAVFLPVLHVYVPVPGLFLFSAWSLGREPGTGPVQPGCRGCVVWSISPELCASSSATKRARGREGREKELVRQERKLMAVFKKNDGGE